jgi:hypothetical protein
MKVSHLMVGLLSLALSSRAELATAQVVPVTETEARAEKKEPPSVPVAVENGKATLTPKNTTIQFVGLHTGDDPKPRTVISRNSRANSQSTNVRTFQRRPMSILKPSR